MSLKIIRVQIHDSKPGDRVVWWIERTGRAEDLVIGTCFPVAFRRAKTAQELERIMARELNDVDNVLPVRVVSRVCRSSYFRVELEILSLESRLN